MIGFKSVRLAVLGPLEHCAGARDDEKHFGWFALHCDSHEVAEAQAYGRTA